MPGLPEGADDGEGRGLSKQAVCAPAPAAVTGAGIITSPEWSPRHDPGFARSWLTHLIMGAGEWWHPTQVWQTHDERQRRVLRECAGEAVLKAERLGLIVETDHRLGYRVLGMDPPPYLHLHRRAEDREPEPCIGQLTIEEVGAVG